MKQVSDETREIRVGEGFANFGEGNFAVGTLTRKKRERVATEATYPPQRLRRRDGRLRTILTPLWRVVKGHYLQNPS